MDNRTEKASTLVLRAKKTIADIGGLEVVGTIFKMISTELKSMKYKEDDTSVDPYKKNTHNAEIDYKIETLLPAGARLLESFYQGNTMITEDDKKILFGEPPSEPEKRKVANPNENFADMILSRNPTLTPIEQTLVEVEDRYEAEIEKMRHLKNEGHIKPDEIDKSYAITDLYRRDLLALRTIFQEAGTYLGRIKYGRGAA